MAEVVRTYHIDVLDDGNIAWREVNQDGTSQSPKLEQLAAMFRIGLAWYDREMLALRVVQMLKPTRVMLPGDGKLHI